MTTGTTFPRFPTQFTEGDALRLKELENQRKLMEKAYQTKFTPEAWAKTSFPEKAVRNLLPTWLSPVVKAITPEPWGLDYGFTPEQFQQKQLDLEAEYKEFVRKEKVTRLLPSIETDMVIAALSGNPITSLSDLTTSFPELQTDFTEEERGYLSNLAQTILHSPIEDVLSGKIFESGQLALTQEDINRLAKSLPSVSPQYLLSTVAFSKNIDEVSRALQMAYPPQVDEETVADETRQKILDYFSARAKELGITVGKEPTKEDIQKVHTAIAEQEGKLLNLTDTESGTVISTKVRLDNTIWATNPDTGKDELIGYWQGEKVTSLDKLPGDPGNIFNEFYKAFKVSGKQSWESMQFYLTGLAPYQMARTGMGLPTTEPVKIPKGREADVEILSDIFPAAIFDDMIENLRKQPESVRVKRIKEYVDSHNKYIVTSAVDLKLKWDKSQKVFQDWLTKNPGLYNPRYEYSVTDHPELLKDAGWWGYTIGSIAPPMIIAIGAGALTTVATGSPMVGALVSTTTFDPLNKVGVYEDMMANGATEAQAADASFLFGIIISAVEVLPDMITLKAVSPLFMKAFRKNLTSELTELVTKSMVVKGVLKTAGKVEIAETTEEVLQQAIQNAAVRTVNENRSLLENLDDVTIQALVGMLPMALTGGLGEYRRMKVLLPAKTQKQIDAIATPLKEAGMDEVLAESVAVAEIMSTDEGKAQIELAQEKASMTFTEVSLPEQVVNTEKKLSTIQEDINTYTSSIKAQEERLTKVNLTERDELVETISGLKERLLELEADKKRVVSKLKKLNTAKKVIVPQLEPRGIEKFDEIGQDYDNQLRQLRADFIEGAISKTNYEQAVKDVLTEKHKVTPVAEPTPEGAARAVEAPTVVLEIPKGWKVEVGKVPIEKGLEGESITGKAMTDWQRKVITVSDAKYLSDPAIMNEEIAHIRLEELPDAIKQTAISEYEKAAEYTPIEIRSQFARREGFGQDYGNYLTDPSSVNPEIANVFEKYFPSIPTPINERIIQKIKELDERVAETEARFQEGKATSEDVQIAKSLRARLPASIEDIPRQPIQVTFGQTEEEVSLAWDELSYAEKVARCEEVGIAKTAANLTWSELTSIQQERLQGIRPPPEAVEEDALGVLPVPTTPEGRGYSPDKRPRNRDWSEETVIASDMVAENPIIKAAIKLPKTVKEARAKAETYLTELHARLNLATDEEVKKPIRAEFKELSKRTKAKIGYKDLLVKTWEMLTPTEKDYLTTAMIPDKSITFPALKEFADMRYIAQFLQEYTGLPFYRIFKRIVYAHGNGRAAYEYYIKKVGNNPAFNSIKENPESIARVAQEINARNPALKIEHPDLSVEEMLLANTIEEIFKGYEPYVRYMKVMRTTSNLEAFKRAFPDAADEQELQFAIDFKTREDLDGLFNFLKGVNWGTIKAGYDPRLMRFADLFPNTADLDSTRGEARLLRRESTEYNEALMEKQLLQRFATYIRQIEAQFRLKPELDVFGDLWDLAFDKFTNSAEVEGMLRNFAREVQSLPYGTENAGDRLIRATWRQATAAVFLPLYMSVRNSVQAVVMHPDRTELLRTHFTKLPQSVVEKANRYYDVFVSQLSGIKTDWLYVGERGWVGLGWLNKIADRIGLFTLSDKLPRHNSFNASFGKAWRATQEYQSSAKNESDLAKWLKKSGVGHLRASERNYALELMAQLEMPVDLAVEGLSTLNGDEMVSAYIAHEVTDMANLVYERPFRSPVEMGATGRTVFNLFVFPRGVAQRFILQGSKMFSKDTTWEQASSGIKDVLLIFIVGEIVSHWLTLLSNRKRESYSLFNMIQWEIGGLAIGAPQDIFTCINDIVTILNPLGNKENKEAALSRLPVDLRAAAGVMIPFYRYLTDILDSVFQVKGSDLIAMRAIRAQIDKDYTPQELEKMDRDVWEIIRKVALGGEIDDPSRYQQIQSNLIEAEDKLGTMDVEGRYYTLRQFAGDIKTNTTPVPDSMVIPGSGFSDMVIFYKDCAFEWEELYNLSSSGKARTEWRLAHPEVESMLLFWGMYQKSVFAINSPEWADISSTILVWFDLYKLDKRAHPAFADWTLPIPD